MKLLVIILMILLAACRGNVYDLDKRLSTESEVSEEDLSDEETKAYDEVLEEVEDEKDKKDSEEVAEKASESDKSNEEDSKLDNEKVIEESISDTKESDEENKDIDISNMPNPGIPIYYERSQERELGDYSNYSNEERSWWFKRPKPTHKGVLADIDIGIRKIIENYDFLWQADTTSNKVYLTFDEGYEYNNNTTKILDTLKAKGVKSAFFITGGFLRENPKLVKRMYDEGHIICNHTDMHLSGPNAINESEEKFIKDITNLEDAYRDLMGQDIHPFFRPPSGEYSERSIKIANDLGYTAVLWSFAYHDWDTKAQPDPTKALNQIVGELHNGSVILLHSVSNTNVAILSELIDKIREAGYEIDSIDNI